MNEWCGEPAPTGEAGAHQVPAARLGVRARWIRRLGWATGGAVLASALWLAATMVAGQQVHDDRVRTSPAAASHKYRFAPDMCAATDLANFTGSGYALAPPQAGREGPQPNPDGISARQPALDRSLCHISLQRRASESANGNDAVRAYLLVTAEWHKRTDPRSEFDARHRAISQRPSVLADLVPRSSYQVTAIPGLGDAAYLVEARSLATSSLTSIDVAVCDGDFTYLMSFFETDHRHESNSAATADLLTRTAKATMKALRQ